MKKVILIFALSRSPWIGGIYYRKNIIDMMLHSASICRKYDIVLLVNKKYANVFSAYDAKIKIIQCPDSTSIIRAALYMLFCCIRYRIKYIFPVPYTRIFKLFGVTPVSWIADFQHCHYPEFFEQVELDTRNRNFARFAAADNPLVLSSKDALADFKKYFVKSRKNVHVVHFSSAIQDELKKIEWLDANAVFARHRLKGYNYYIICNQFWKHKNHKVVLQAIRILSEKNFDTRVKFAFTGEPNDRRNPHYIEEIKSLMKDEKVQKYVVHLGFIDRTEQLYLMKHAQAIIQPSLFEGWGTVVEDGKVLGKRMILSDIPVHFEQGNQLCTYFEKDNAQDLAVKIIDDYEKKDSCSLRNDIVYEHSYVEELEAVFQ